LLVSLCAISQGAQGLTEPYLPRFTFDIKRGIFDHGNQITCLRGGQAEAPQPSLRYVVLAPGKNPNLDQIHCYWLTGERLKNLKVETEGQNTDRLVIKFKSEEEKGRYTDEREVVVTYDPEMKSYVYTCEARFKVLPGKTYRATYLEFTDPHWLEMGLPGPSIPVDFIDMMAGGGPIVKPTYNSAKDWRPLFQFFAYEAADGNVYQVALNHRHHKGHRALPLKENGIYAALYNPEYGNVAFQLLGATARRTDIEICMWGYDIHMRYALAENREEHLLRAGDTVVARFRVFQLPAQKALELMQRARPQPLPPEEVLSYLRPVYRLHSTFDETMDPYKTGGDVDPNYWYVEGAEEDWNFLATTGAVWRTDMGRGDNYCVGCVNTEPKLSRWVAFTGLSHWTGVAPPRDKVWKMTAYVKTKGVEGKGAFVSLQQELAGQKGEKRESEPLTGTNDWTEVSVLAAPGAGSWGNFYVRLELDGQGAAWFDDVRMEVVDCPWPEE